MDARAEHAVFTALRSLTRGQDGQRPRMTVLVTHRLANIRQADQIIVLNHGRITERGTHDQLIAKTGTYYELFSLQARAYSS